MVRLELKCFPTSWEAPTQGFLKDCRWGKRLLQSRKSTGTCKNLKISAAWLLIFLIKFDVDELFRWKHEISNPKNMIMAATSLGSSELRQKKWEVQSRTGRTLCQWRLAWNHRVGVWLNFNWNACQSKTQKKTKSQKQKSVQWGDRPIIWPEHSLEDFKFIPLFLLLVFFFFLLIVLYLRVHVFFVCCQLQNNTNKTSYNCLSFQHTSSYMPIPPFAGSRWVEEKVLPRRWRLVGSLQRQGSWPEDDDNDHDDDVATGRTAPESLVMIFFCNIFIA